MSVVAAEVTSATSVRARLRRLDVAEWSALQARAPFPHMTQTAPYAQAKSVGRWHAEYFVVERDGLPLAIVAAISMKVAGVAVVTRINRGPLFLAASPSTDEIRDVFGAVRRRWQFLVRGALLIAPNLERTESNRELLKSLGFRQRAERTWGSGRIDLKRSEEEIWASFDPKYRNHARKADKVGATLEVSGDDGAFEWMLERHRENMRQKGFSGTDIGFLRRLRSAAGAENMLVFKVVRDGEPVSGGIVYRFGRTAEYYVGWVGQAGRDIAAGNHMLWRMALEMKQRGCEALDVGGMSGAEKYSQFKPGTNPAQYDLAGEWMTF
jgi:lipid II:glycine glycyltransferase (peptidoglycan interpeptide bridge formation enzyme)